MPEAVMAGNQYLSILKKHGWDETFWTKLTTILQDIHILYTKKGKRKPTAR